MLKIMHALHFLQFNEAQLELMIWRKGNIFVLSFFSETITDELSVLPHLSFKFTFKCSEIFSTVSFTYIHCNNDAILYKYSRFRYLMINGGKTL